MRSWPTCAFILGGLLLGYTCARAASADLRRWFNAASAWDASGSGTSLSKPDFLAGTSLNSMHCGARGVAIGNGIWSLLKYDRRHQIGLAAASTDQCSVSVFNAPPPGVPVADGNLSRFCTGRGICIGSSYGDVLSAYGGSGKHGRHFVAFYTANVPDRTVSGKKVIDSEELSFVIKDDRVSAITVSVDLSGQF